MSFETADAPSSVASDDWLGDMFYPLYVRLFSEDSSFVADLERKLAESRMPETVEHYLSRALGIGVISGGLLWLFGMIVGYALFGTGLIDIGAILGMPVSNEALRQFLVQMRIPFLIVVTGVVFGSIGFGIGFGTLVIIPYSRASSRKREINMLLPDAISFMYALSIGGMNQLEILQSIAKADDTYGEVAREFQTIIQETQFFDTDYRTAIRQQSMQTPSKDFSQFLTDMLSIVSSGGDMTRFLDEKKEKHMRTAKQQQELTLDTLELFGEMFMTLSLFPLLLIIILVIMNMLGEGSQFMLYGTVYGLIPITGVGFLVLIATVKQDEPGDGFLDPDGSTAAADPSRNQLLDLGLIERYVGSYAVFDRIKEREGTYETLRLLQRPHVFFRDNPLYTLVLTVPASLVIVVTAVMAGSAPTSFSGLVARPVWGTFIWVYVPMYIALTPLAIFREWNIRSRRKVLHNLSDNLRKLASANDTGLTLLESIKTVADTTPGKLSEEFKAMYAKVNYGMNLSEALIEFNNRYHIPRLARTVKLIGKAQEASSHISSGLSTAAVASENQDDIDRDRKSRTRMQVVIILMTYFTLLAVMAVLKTQFLDVMAELTTNASSGGGPASGFGGSVDTNLLSLLFFHAVTMQAIISGLISGFIRDADILSGVKFIIVLITIALGVWIVVG